MDQLNRRFQVARWIAEEFAGIINEEDKLQLKGWRQESLANEQEYQELLQDILKGCISADSGSRRVGNEWKKFSARNIKRSVPWLRRIGWTAAVVTLLLGGGGVVRWQMGRSAVEHVSEGVRMAKGDVMLILSNGKEVAIGKDSVRMLTEETAAVVQMADNTISYVNDKERQPADVYNTLKIPKGGEYKVVLADGSRVWLNSETEFRYPVNFTGESRRVYLKGEAYFEVAKDAERPFVVRALGGVDVKVLGTRFNLTSYPDDQEVVTTLAEGSVEVCTPRDAVRIRPDEQVLFNRDSHVTTRRQVDAESYLSWKDGKFIFEDQTLEQIMKQLQRWYQMEVFYTTDALKDYRFSGDLKKYDDFGKIVRMIEEVAGLHISVKNECVVIGAK